MLLVAVVRSFTDGNAMRYVLPVFSTTSCFYRMERMGQNQKRLVCFVQFARWRHRERSLPSPTGLKLREFFSSDNKDPGPIAPQCLFSPYVLSPLELYR